MHVALLILFFFRYWKTLFCRYMLFSARELCENMPNRAYYRFLPVSCTKILLENYFKLI